MPFFLISRYFSVQKLNGDGHSIGSRNSHVFKEDPCLSNGINFAELFSLFAIFIHLFLIKCVIYALTRSWVINSEWIKNIILCLVSTDSLIPLWILNVIMLYSDYPFFLITTFTICFGFFPCSNTFKQQAFISFYVLV